MCILAAANGLLLRPHLGDHCAIDEAVVSCPSRQGACSIPHGRQSCLQDVDPVNCLRIHHTAAAGAGQVVSVPFACLSLTDDSDCMGAQPRGLNSTSYGSCSQRLRGLSRGTCGCFRAQKMRWLLMSSHAGQPGGQWQEGSSSSIGGC